MPKTTKVTNIQVMLEITPPEYMKDGPERIDSWRKRAQVVTENVRKLADMDMLPNVDGADWDVTSEDVCSLCDSLWTEDSSTYNGGCCDDDEKNNPEVSHE